LQAVKSEINKDSTLLIANVAVASWAMSNDDIDLLASSVDGVSFEMPFHSSARRSKKTIVRQLEVYRRLLDEDKLIVLIAVPDQKLKLKAERDNESRIVAALAMMARRPGDRIYVAWPFYRMPEDWTDWPAVLGAPRGDFSINGLVIQRTFAHATLILDLAENRITTEK
jgi:hypothetical protein